MNEPARSQPRTAPQGRHARALERRIKHLEKRVNKAGTDSPLSYDLNELEALRVAQAVITLYRAEQTGQQLATAFLLEETVHHLTGDHRAQTMQRTTLVLDLMARAKLLEQLGEP